MKFHNLNLANDNPSKLSRPQLRQICGSAAREQAAKQGGNFIKGWAAAKNLFPNMFAALENSAPPSETSPDVMNKAALAKLPIASEQNITKMMLPRDISPDHFAQCWKANGSQCASVNHQAVFDALSDAIMGDNGGTRDAADATAARRAPALAHKVNSTATARMLAANDPAPNSGFGDSTRPELPEGKGSELPPVDNPFLPKPEALANSRGVALANSAGLRGEEIILSGPSGPALK